MYFIDKADCAGCAACYAVCPQKCIRLKEDEEGFSYPEVDTKLCVSCDKCRQICPVLNKTDRFDDTKTQAYVVCHKEQNVRAASASGGAFTMFAEYVLQRGGVVYGVCYDENWNVVHKACEKYRDLDKFRGSKYVQSEMGDIYECVKNKLIKGKYVLFTGTPCQIEGLLRYLGETYERLITIDIACHGVSSISLWKKYINDEEKEHRKKIVYKKCRDKSRGWRHWGMVSVYNDGSKRDRVYYEDPHTDVYHSHNVMRYSCYRCRFRNIFNKECDATMADCWGIEHFAPEMDDDLGASILFLHSEKIRKLWPEISSCANIKKVNPYRALQGNIGALGKNMEVPRVRPYIYGDILKMENFNDAAQKYRHIPSKKERIIGKYPNLHKRYANLKSKIAPIRLKLIYKKNMKHEIG